MASEKNSLQLTVTNRQILKIALPISLAILVPQLNFITNNIFLGHYSTEALAVASITGVYYLIFAGIGYGGAPPSFERGSVEVAEGSQGFPPKRRQLSPR